jgi:hypothetical protein
MSYLSTYLCSVFCVSMKSQAEATGALALPSLPNEPLSSGESLESLYASVNEAIFLKQSLVYVLIIALGTHFGL